MLSTEGGKALKRATEGTVIVPLCLLLALLGLIACRSNGAAPTPPAPDLFPGPTISGTPIPFKMVERSESGEYPNREPALLVISSPGGANPIRDFIRAETLAWLRSVDYDDFVAIAAFQGHKPTDKYAITIQRVSQRAEMVFVEADFTVPDPEREAADIETSPYHIVLVRRDDLGDQARTFHLVAGGNVVATASEMVP
jgi:hypothetical protein